MSLCERKKTIFFSWQRTGILLVFSKNIKQDKRKVKRREKRNKK
jgi:hypothetical protein